MLKYCMLTLSALLISIFCFGQNPKAEKELQAVIDDLDVVGLSVVVVNKGDIVYKHQFGMQDVEKNIPLSDRTLFRIASISKSFSAVAIMQLIETGKLSLDDDASKLMGFAVRNPKYPDKVITLKMLLSHTSSVNDSQGYFYLDLIDPAKNPNWAKCYSDYAPGTKYLYCNLNFNMIGAIIERQTGERFDQRIKHRILDPLGLYGGYCVDSLDASRFATLYDYDSLNKSFTPMPQAYAPRTEEIRNYTMGYTTPVFSPTGGMKITAEDLAKYMTMHMYNGSYKGVKIMSEKSAEKMREKISEEEGYGMAMRTAADLIPGKVLKGHTGSAYGLYSAMFFDPKDKFGFVVITNGCIPDNQSDIRNVLSRSMVILYNNIIKK
ncbi:serine hydrolase domain-containing protein [Chryseolinea soli]|uniref:Class A beta-lactamase-related serine hydrolase n=1 Tax=Chryseolinea soli TaxID=2321403 RepID=A0A385SZH9_9BACT|nr:serine hydrolase domain-containing protein [Chryseolinea soli]AYB35537.1 class A beta-lactamase-related serine hydrolase [Chryseolinea soli]